MSELTPTPLSISTRLILDTNVAIEFINNIAQARARVHAQATLFVPSIVLGELFYGAHKSRRVVDNLANVEQLAAAVKVLVVDLGIARRYGEVRASLERKGRRIPENDMWLAATALTHALPVATRDAHFDHVDGLQILRW